MKFFCTAFGKAHADPNRTESVGLGLTVSRNLAQLMGGDVRYCRSDGWTCFELRLPIAPQHKDTQPVSTDKEIKEYAGTT